MLQRVDSHDFPPVTNKEPRFLLTRKVEVRQRL